MKPASPGEPTCGPAPWLALAGRLIAACEAMERAGQADAARAVRQTVEAWGAEQRAWDAEAVKVLAAHHEINNALVGVRGHAQLLMMGPAGQLPGVRERLEVVIRESGRIQEAAQRIRDLKQAIDGPGLPARAA